MLLGAIDQLRNNLYNLHVAIEEENRNLCEDDPDKAECIREVEEAKANPGINDVQQEGKIRALVPYFVNVSVKFRRCNSSRKQAFYASLGCAQQILKISSSGDKA